MPSPSLTILDSFAPNTLSAGLVADASGNLYGTTQFGGANGYGTVFVLQKSGSGYSSPVTLASFNGANGDSPEGGLIIDSAGNLYGTTSAGGAYGKGTVFELAKSSGLISTLISFDGGTTGSLPESGLIEDKNGNLLGTTFSGGLNNLGTVFGISAANTFIYSVSFNGGGNGATPLGSLISDAAGDLFGTTLTGGASGKGTVFELAKSNSGYSAPITLATFTGGNGSGPNAMTIDAAGDLFGTTSSGGASNDGTVFELAKTSLGYSQPVVLTSFTGNSGASLGAQPSGLIIDAAGDLFGTTSSGGAFNAGTVFELENTKFGYSNSVVTLETFNGQNGAIPNATLIADAAGNLFGTTLGYKPTGIPSTLFEITNSGFVTGSPPAPAPSTSVHANDLTYSSTASGANHFIDLLNFEASYSDLIRAFGTNQSAMQNWYNTNEINENRVETFDGLDYVASYGDLIKAFGGAGSLKAVQDDGATHFISYGQNEGRSTSFNGLDYIASYGDLINAFGADNDAGAYHYIEYGSKEGRSVSFDGLAYIANYSDLMNVFGANEQAGAAHYINFGDKEGRTTTFNVAAYESSHPDLIGQYASNDAFLAAYINTYKTTGHLLT